MAKKVKISKEELEKLCLSGLNRREISRILGLSIETIYQYLSRYNIKTCKKESLVEDLTGQKYNKLTVLSFDGLDRHNKAKWRCLCECGTIKSINACSIKKGLTKTCGCKSRELKRGNGYKDIPYQFFRRASEGATKRDLSFEITIEDVWNQYEKQDRKCYYTGLDIKFMSNMSNEPHLATASIDRVDSNKGYSIDNIVICHKSINAMKSFLKVGEFISWCNLVSKQHRMEHEDCINNTDRKILRKV